MTYFLLFAEFFKIGLFAIGGGYATIPFLFHLTEKYGWFSGEELTNMIAISNMTPGPVGVNMATYSGFMTKGIFGSLISTLGIVLAPFIITLITIYFLQKFRKSILIKKIFEALRPVSIALLTFVLIQLFEKNIFKSGNFDIKALILLTILFLTYPFIKKYPSLIILFGAILGVIFNSL